MLSPRYLMICMQLFQNLTQKKMQNPRYSSNESSVCAFLLFPLRPGRPLWYQHPSTGAPVVGGPDVGTVMWGILGCSSGTCRDTRTGQCAFPSCLCVSPEAKPHDSSPARQLQATDTSQVSRRDLVTKDPWGIVA